MPKIVTANDVSFDIEYGGPVSITENVVFLVKIVGSSIDSVHETFKKPENTETLTLFLNDVPPGEVYSGYTRYHGFELGNDGGITVILKKRS